MSASEEGARFHRRRSSGVFDGPSIPYRFDDGAANISLEELGNVELAAVRGNGESAATTCVASTLWSKRGCVIMAVRRPL